MRTFGRRMHARARPEFAVSARPVQRLEAMNLGEVVPLTESEALAFQCRDVHGRVLDGVYAAPVASAGSTIALGNRVVTFSKRPLCSRMQSSADCSVAGRCVADARAERTLDDGSRGRRRSQPALAPRQFEHEVAAWHKPRVSAARVVLEEADRLFRKGRNPGEGASCQDMVPAALADPIASCGPRRTRASRTSGCGGTWSWRVELRKRAVLLDRSRDSLRWWN